MGDGEGFRFGRCVGVAGLILALIGAALGLTLFFAAIYTNIA